MILASFALPGFLIAQAQVTPDPNKPPLSLDPREASEIVKGFARHLGAVLVGICRVKPLWVYSHRGEIFCGNWEDWGREIGDPLPYAVVVATEMDLEVADQFGPRVRLFAVTTDMPLQTDRPVDKGIEAFCRCCKKCATACPSRSISLEGMTVQNGLERWKLNEESCFEYWGRVGTDCSVRMGICPFSRPNRSVHRIVKWLLPRSSLAQRLLPHLDNRVYGQKWKPRAAAPWARYQGKNIF